MSVESFSPVPIEQFGGLATLPDPSDVPLGMSPECQDVEFIPGGVRTRPGTSLAFAAISANPRLNGLKSYVTLTLEQRLLAACDDGRLFKGNPGSTLSAIKSDLKNNLRLKSQTAYGSEWLAFSDGKSGQDLPYQYNDARFDRVSQEGPGEGPGASAEGVTTVAISAIARSANVVTVTTASAHGLSAGWRVVISRVTDSTFDGEFIVLSVGSATTLTFAQTGSDASSSGGYLAGWQAWTIAALPTDQTPRYQAAVEAAHPAGDDYQYISDNIIVWHGNAFIFAFRVDPADLPGGNDRNGDAITGIDIYFPYNSDSNAYQVKASWGAADNNGMFAWATYGSHDNYLAFGWTPPDPPVVNYGLVRSGNVVTCTVTTDHTITPGQSVRVSGAVDGVFDGTFVVTGAPDARTLTWAQSAEDANSGGGYLEVLGSALTAGGDRDVAVFFVTRTDYWTKVSPATKFTTYAGRKISLTKIPTGPPNVVARGIALTTADGATYFHVKSKMWIDDNTTTSLTIDITDDELTAGLNVDYLKRLEVLANAAGVTLYDDRLIWWGEENALAGFRNLGFDGGFASARPLGWSAVVSSAGAGGSVETTDVVWAGAYKITGNGDAVRGQITQGVYHDAWGDVELLRRNTAYTVRARVKRSAGLAAGRLNIDLYGTGIDTAGLQLAAGAVTETWTDYEAVLITAQANLPSDLVLRIFADQTPTTGEYFLVDEIRILPTNEKIKTSYVRVSKIGDPETFDGVQGFLMADENNGQSVRNVFRIRNYLYIVKERSLFVTQSDGQSEPYQWTVEEISAVVGTPTLQGIGLGDGWGLIADRAGAYRFDGAILTDEARVSQEIQPTWERINWEGAGHTVWTVIDTKRKRALFGVPLDAATAPSHVLVLDYTEGWASGIENGGQGRKWTIWNLAANSAGIIESSSGPRLFLGSNNASGKIWELVNGQRSDNGVAINGYYDTAYIGSPGFGRQLFGYLVAFVYGAGTWLLHARQAGGVVTKTLLSRTLSATVPRDTELAMNLLSERVSFRIQTNAVDEWFECTKFVPYVKQDPWAPQRGK